MRPVNAALENEEATPLLVALSARASQPFTLGLLGAVFLVTLVVGWAFRPAGENLGRANPQHPNLLIGIDPNAAQWFELAQLPGIGESLGRKIVAYRESRRAAGPVFESAKDLLPVPGIGPRMVTRLGPFLRYPARATQFDSVSLSR